MTCPEERFVVIGGGRETLPLVLEVNKRGLNPLVVDKDTDSLSGRMGFELVPASVYEPTVVVSSLRNFLGDGGAISGVATLGVDCALSVAAVAEEFGVPGISRISARTGSNKLLQKRLLEHLSIPTAELLAVGGAGAGVSAIPRDMFPAVLKPIDSRGSRGVFLCNNPAQADEMLENAIRESPSGEIIVEKFMPGPQFSSETVVLDGVATTVGISSRNYSLNEFVEPEFLENGGTVSAAAFKSLVPKVNQDAEAIMQGLGIANGTIKGDLVWSEDSLSWVEFALRPSGGYFASHEIPLAFGIDLVSVVVDLALGLSVPADRLQASKDLAVCQRYIFSPDGEAHLIKVPEEVRLNPHVLHVEIFEEASFRLLGGRLKKVGMVLTGAQSSEQAERAARTAVSQIVSKSKGLADIELQIT